MSAVPWELWPLLVFAVAVGWLWDWGLRRNSAWEITKRRRRVMQRLARARNHDHGGGAQQ